MWEPPWAPKYMPNTYMTLLGNPRGLRTQIIGFQGLGPKTLNPKPHRQPALEANHDPNVVFQRGTVHGQILHAQMSHRINSCKEGYIWEITTALFRVKGVGISMKGSLKGVYTGDMIREYYRGYSGGYWEFRL